MDSGTKQTLVVAVNKTYNIAVLAFYIIKLRIVDQNVCKKKLADFYIYTATFTDSKVAVHVDN